MNNKIAEGAKTWEWEIYALKDPVSGQIRYIGFSKDAKKRLTRHLQSALKENKDWPSSRWIRKLDGMGLKPNLEIIEHGCGEWESREKFWIAYYRNQDINLLNVRDGGMEVPAKSRISAAEKLKNRIFTLEHRQRISEAKKGVPRIDAAECAARFRKAASNNRGKKMALSDAERKRRSEHGAEMGHKNSMAIWGNMTVEERARRSDMAREQMRRIWAERKAARHGSGE